MQIKIGYEFGYYVPQATPMIVMTNVHGSRASSLMVPDNLRTDPPVPITAYRDGFGNWCNRIVVPPGRIRLSACGVVTDSGEPDVVVPDAFSTRSRICRKKRSCTFWAVAIARWIYSASWLGICSETRLRAGNGCRRFVILFTTILHSTIN